MLLDTPATRSVAGLNASLDILHPERPKRIVMLASNPAVSEQTGSMIGFWWAGGALRADPMRGSLATDIADVSGTDGCTPKRTP